MIARQRQPLGRKISKTDIAGKQGCSGCESTNVAVSQTGVLSTQRPELTGRRLVLKMPMYADGRRKK
jgi:hypothetical protein